MKVPLARRIAVYSCLIIMSLATASALKATWVNLRFAEAVRRIEQQRTQDEQDQADALALLARIDGKATFDPAHPKRVIAIDI